MLLLIQIALTVVAWRRGWKAWALAPILITVGLGFLVGLICGATGTDLDSILGPCLVFDLGCVVVLVAMVVCRRGSHRGPCPAVTGESVALAS